LGYNDGILELRAGKASGVTFIFRANTDISFLKPVKIVVPYERSLHPISVTGYAIDEEGHLHLMDTGGINEADGTISFYTFKCLVMTWVYIMK
jgi:hypothetical protein